MEGSGRPVNSGVVIEVGTVLNGTPYRVWWCFATQRRIVYLGAGSGKRRSVKWLRKTQKEELRLTGR